MKTDDRHVAWLRAQIGGDETTMRQIMADLSGPGDLDPLAPLIHRAFTIAVRRVFGTQFTHGEVIRLVANVRSLLSEAPVPVDPVAAESEVRRALGEHAPAFPDPDARTVAQLTVLDCVVRDLRLGDRQIDDLLGEARQPVTSAKTG